MNEKNALVLRRIRLRDEVIKLQAEKNKLLVIKSHGPNIELIQRMNSINDQLTKLRVEMNEIKERLGL